MGSCNPFCTGGKTWDPSRGAAALVRTVVDDRGAVDGRDGRALGNGLEGHAAVFKAVAAETSVGLLDVTPWVCPGGVCESITAEGLIRYRDGTHSSVPQIQALIGPFTEALSRYQTVP